MEAFSSKMTIICFLLISMILISSAAPILDCGSSCSNHPHKHKKKPIVKPPINLPPVTEPVSPANNCPIDTLKLSACVDLLGGLVHIGIGEPVMNRCCPILEGLVELEAAACICTTLKLKLLNLNIYIPLALQLLVTCGKTPPPGFTCIL
ncbi:36.4 kDa proline-rich protein-like [Impatiens glandulifera]|uniref:36.4 kDa proline-rich protein-like n=1 Tax=Impatiens glandulifera TaxID=253017 RepID=UPI001FB076AF|nr:36.4 kDa proline-rich protein-like [Impatiens glandulifera]